MRATSALISYSSPAPLILSPQARAHQVVWTRLRPKLLDRATDRLVRVGLFEPKRNQREDRIVYFLIRRRERAFGAARFPGASRPDFVLEFHHDAFGSFLANAADL